MSVQAAAYDIITQLPEPLAQPLAYSRAIATVLSMRFVEGALGAAAGIGMAVAEQPQRMRELADEVQAVAQQELKAAGSGGQQRLLSASSSAGSAGGGAAGGSGRGSSDSSADLAAIVDELRADIAASRALLQQIRADGGSSGGNGTGSTAAGRR